MSEWIYDPTAGRCRKTDGGQAMSEDKIEEIHKRHAFADENKSVIRPTGFSWTIPGWQAHNDRAFLLAEVDRQRAENEQLRVDLATQQGCCDGAAAQDAHVRREREEHKAEVEKLRAEIERLREALTDVANQETTGPYKWQLVVVRLCEIARETLEGKP